MAAIAKFLHASERSFEREGIFNVLLAYLSARWSVLEYPFGRLTLQRIEKSYSASFAAQWGEADEFEPVDSGLEERETAVV